MGAPPGFSSGNTWTAPLVDPLADGRLVVPVKVDGHGPYLFVLDRDSGTVVDPQVIDETGVRVESPLRLDDYHDTTHPGFYAELPEVEIGSLTISLVPTAITNRAGVFDEDGRRIQGILGRDFIADSLVFGIDRDRGIVWLQTQEAFHPPPGATAIETTKDSSAGVKVAWRPVLRDAKVGGVALDLHPDFSQAASELAPSRWAAAKLQPVATTLQLIDNAGITRTDDRIGIASQVTVGPIVREHIAFAPYDDRRLWEYQLDGTLGLDFFRPFEVASDWHHEVIYLRPRGPEPASRALRLERWGDELPLCPHPGCVSIELDHQLMHVRPDPGVKTKLEVVIAATSAAGAPLSTLYVNLPAGSSAFDDPLDPSYAGAKLEVVDASPFPRNCPGGGPCVMVQAPVP